MNEAKQKILSLARRRNRVRASVVGTSERPRLSVFISNQHISAQLIDDSKHRTLASASTLGSKAEGTTRTEKAAWVGSQIGKKAKKAKISKAVLDRNGRLYHGRVKALADAARQEGLEF